MKKKLDTDQITNELKGQSLYFENQSKRLAKKTDDGERPNERTRERTNARTGEHPNERTRERTNTRTAERVNERTAERANARTAERVNIQIGEKKPTRRTITRHSYQFYADQVANMKSLWLSYQARGLDIDLSDLAREAFDEYLTRIKEKANERTNERTDERTHERVNKRTSERANGRTGERANAKKRDLTRENESV